MARTTQSGYTNTTPSSKTITLTALGLDTNYTRIKETESDYIVDNMTAPTDQTELIRINSYPTKDVKLNSGLKNEYPAEASSAMTLVVGLDYLLSTTDSEVPEFRIDDGISLTLTMKYGTSARVTPEEMEVALNRLMSIFYRDDGTSRLPALMRGSKSINTI